MTRLQALAAQTGRSEAEIVVNTIEQSLEDQEDIRIADGRIAALRAGRSRTYTLEEVEFELGLAD